MFLLSEREFISSIPLKNISRIDIAFYKSKNESLNIFNLELDFDENLIPLITSTLECQPVLIRRKTYFGIDTDYIIERNINYNSNLSFLLKDCDNENERFSSFHTDIDKFNKHSSIQKSYWQTRQLHYSNVYIKSQELVRIYARADLDSNGYARGNDKIFNPQDTLGCKEEIVIYWPVNGNGKCGKFELCIASNNTNTNGKNNTNDKNNTNGKNRNNRTQCIWRLVVDIIEDNYFIDSKVDVVNIWLEKIHKIKSTIKIANQETNSKQIEI